MARMAAAAAGQVQHFAAGDQGAQRRTQPEIVSSLLLVQLLASVLPSVIYVRSLRGQGEAVSGDVR
jgi:hypothetical protein